MSFSKVLCIAVVGGILSSSAAMARPDTTGQPPASTQVQKGHHKHRLAKAHKAARRHHRKHAPKYLNSPNRPA